ncbi:MAG: hypothetical protein WD847_18605 [Pirellulales bacterium]
MAKRINPSNLRSPAQIGQACRLDDLDGWFADELRAVKDAAVQRAVRDVASNLDAFVQWPREAVLLWPGCCRTSKYHCYPEAIKVSAKAAKIRLDTRSNGPAVVAFLHGGGKRPLREGSRNQWSIHHLYFGRFP